MFSVPKIKGLSLYASIDSQCLHMALFRSLDPGIKAAVAKPQSSSSTVSRRQFGHQTWNVCSHLCKVAAFKIPPSERWVHNVTTITDNNWFSSKKNKNQNAILCVEGVSIYSVRDRLFTSWLVTALTEADRACLGCVSLRWNYIMCQLAPQQHRQTQNNGICICKPLGFRPVHLGVGTYFLYIYIDSLKKRKSLLHSFQSVVTRAGSVGPVWRSLYIPEVEMLPSLLLDSISLQVRQTHTNKTFKKRFHP